MRTILLGTAWFTLVISAAAAQTCGDSQLLSDMTNSNTQATEQSPIGGTSTAPQAAPIDPSNPNTSAMQAMLAQPYGQAAVNASNQLGVNPASTAAIGQAESGFRNVPTANGTSSATGPWQITNATFQQYAPSGASQTDPTAQAQVAPAIIRDYAEAVGNATGQPATTSQAYSAYVFGPTAGAQIANADPSTPLSAIVSPKALQNNGMTGWSVGQFNSTMGQRLGPAANQPVLIGSA